MDSKGYLVSYGWKEGEALKKGGLKRPILVKQKRDTKGLGNDIDDGEVWWEKLFDVQLKNLEVYNSDKVKFEQRETKVDKSPLYSMFVKGEGLTGTIEVEEKTVQATVKKQIVELNEKKREREKAKKTKRKEDKKEKKKAKESKEKRKDKKGKKGTKDKKEKKDKKPLEEKPIKEKKSKPHKRSRSEPAVKSKRIKV
ncbi:BA75_01794T0 [Komagataella pastoris]|uniref:BA75_01794T0 n=1 Tax=Komagataella pastoris TaxID=4922 RepID=A0A1B2J7Q5_PICPA|nr:BA75_01794T0 [Komagataella pastoris]